MTYPAALEPMLDLVADLARELSSDRPLEQSSERRYARLLSCLQQLFPCDAVALLGLRGSVLHPLAVEGLSEDTLGRTFQVEEHPRLARILMSREPVRFQADSDLPDPYDGLIAASDAPLHVHDCLGIALYLDERPWGVLTLDALQPGVFELIDPRLLRSFVRLVEEMLRLTQRIAELQARADREHQVAQAVVAELGRDALIGQSRAMQALLREIEVVAQSDLAALITGETGVGKELVARQIHARSNRAGQPLVYVNCAALPDNLVESELFGHTRGAFSGATHARAGKFELAQGGTLFLDEIGEMPLAMQPKLLRALQSGEVQRVGSDQAVQVDVRIVAATNRDLQREVGSGQFRADLYHRLSVYPIAVPPLRERGRDVLLLAGHFMEQNRRRLGARGVRLDASARAALLDYAWPGNVRELEHLISRAVLRAQAQPGRERRILNLSAELLALAPEPETAAPVVQLSGEVAWAEWIAPLAPEATLREATDAFQRQRIAQALQQFGGNRAAAARSLGLDPGNFSRLLKRLQISTERSG